MEMKRLLITLLKYKLFGPLSFLRFVYYNFIKIARSSSGCFFIPSRYAALDVSKTAKVYLGHSVLFGWCNMKNSKLETALYMAEGSSLELGGADSNSMELIGYGSYIQVGKNAKLKIGNSFINREVKIICNKDISIGDGCVIAMGAVIRDNDGGNHQILSDGYLNRKPIIIGDHVWVGENSMILKGVKVGEGSVIAASSLVTKDVPPHCMVAGVPARIVRENIKWEK